jgi:hypothetical protein
LRRWAWIAALLAGCPHPKPPPPPPPSEESLLRPVVAALSSEAQSVLKAQDENIWRHWTEGAPLEIPKTYEGHDALFTPESIKKIDRLRTLEKDPRERRALHQLEIHFVGEFLARAVSEQSEALAALEASITFAAAGKDTPYRDLDRLLATEKSANKRWALYAAATTAAERLGGLVRLKQERAEAALKELGYAGYEAYGAELREVDLLEAAALAEQVLQVTQGPYEKVLGSLAEHELQLPLTKLRRSDLPRLFRSGGVDKEFPKEAARARANATLSGMGLELGTLPHLTLDDRELPKKNPRPLTVAVNPPQDVRLSFRPLPGVHPEGAFFRELGQALRFLFDPEPRWELARLGPRTAAEAEARVFEDLLADPVWLQEQTGLGPEKLVDYLASTSAFHLYALRLHAARVLYEVEVHRTDGSDAKALYTQVFSRALGFPLNPEEQARYGVDREDFYRSVDDLRAAFLAGQIQAQLKVRFGPAWWHQPGAGQFLKALWARGNASSAQEVAQSLGDTGIKPDQLLLRISALLKVPIPLPGAAQAPDAGSPAARGPADAGS